MNGGDILDTLRAHEPDLRARGVAHIALFGSRARGDARAESDIDVMVESAPDAGLGVWAYAGLKDFICGLFTAPVDVVNRDGLKSSVRPSALSDAIYAF